MLIKYFIYFCLMVSSLAAQTPLSAIDWLSKENSKFQKSLLDEKNTETENTSDIKVPTLTSNEYQAIGLLPIYVTGIPTTIWRNSSFDDLVYSFKTMPSFKYSPIQELVYSLLLAEARPPLNEPARYAFLEARLNKLLKYGAVDPAIALIERASPVPERMIPLLFDISLLSSNNFPVCDPIFQDTKNRDLQAELIYCYARKGDWLTAHLILKTGEVLQDLNDREVSLLDRYLEVDFNVDLNALLPPPELITPLEYRLYEAIGEPIPAEYLPIQYSQSDLSGENGWRAQVIAAERLSLTGAIVLSKPQAKKLAMVAPAPGKTPTKKPKIELLPTTGAISLTSCFVNLIEPSFLVLASDALKLIFFFLKIIMKASLIAKVAITNKTKLIPSIKLIFPKVNLVISERES